MLTAVVTSSGSSIKVTLLEEGVPREDEAEEGTHEVPESDLNPIAPEPKEVFWGFGAFVVMAIAIRYWLFPKVREGMARRYDSIQGDLEQAEALTASARAEVAEYDAQVASVRADAHTRVEAARATLEAERTEQLAATNGRINERRAAAAADVEAARAAAESQVAAAVSEVASAAGQLATGRSPSANAVASAVADSMQTGVSA
ncbi:MAG: ATP synthase F0 subunit B [Acidimicrobiia bacterium]|nr:ATP synthase F0 subunit B [Acidimicrobiia bacterium]